MSKLEIKIPELEHIKVKIDVIMERLNCQTRNPKHIVMDNDGLMDYLKISRSKAAMLRNEGKIAYSKESQTGKVWYLLSDVLDFLKTLRHEKF